MELLEGNTLRKSLQTTSTSPCRTQVQPAASFLVCSLIFIEYKDLSIWVGLFMTTKKPNPIGSGLNIMNYQIVLAAQTLTDLTETGNCP